jgi:hypothetical protein
MDPLKAGDPKVITVSPGEHRIRAATTDGLTKFRIEVEVDQGQRMVEIKLKGEHDQELKRQQEETIRKQVAAEAALHPTWTDPDTGLMWTIKDNGSDVNWNQARDYCSKLQLAGYKDWRLPTIEELQGIYDPSVSVEAVFDQGSMHGARVKGNLRLTGWDWSSSQFSRDGSGLARVYNFVRLVDQEPGSFPVSGFSFNMRALCVRRSGE